MAVPATVTKAAVMKAAVVATTLAPTVTTTAAAAPLHLVQKTHRKKIKKERRRQLPAVPLAATVPSVPVAPAPAPMPAAPSCQVSKVSVRQDHVGRGTMALGDVTAIYGGGTLSQHQKETVTVTPISEASFLCMDDRVLESSLATPGGDLGEFILALSSYLQERGPGPSGDSLPTQQEVNNIFLDYLHTLPSSRPFVHCTDDSALRHLQDELPLEGLDLQRPSKHAMELGLLKKLMEVDNHGDSHIRLMLKEPEWYQINRLLAPMVLRAFYTKLWEQNMDIKSPLHTVPKLRLVMLSGQSDPQAFFEVVSSGLCQGTENAPMITPRKDGRALLVSHLDAVSVRRKELAEFFGRVSNVGPRKIDVARMHQRLDRHGWLALETTGSRMAMGLPFFTLTYS